MDVEPLINDEFSGEPPTKRVLAKLQEYRKQGKAIAGIYCGYAPLELLHAMEIVPAVLCAFSHVTIAKAETVLPANLCPLVKSSYGFIMTDTCPFFGLSDAVIAETTCDGKKKMFELIAHKRPMFVMDLPQLPDEMEARDNWVVMIRKLQRFLEDTFQRKASDEKIEEAIKDTNRKNRLMQRIFDFSALIPSVLSWSELYDAAFMANPYQARDISPVLEGMIKNLEERVKSGYVHGAYGAPRVLVTGCPVSGDAGKVYRAIEEAGGIIVAIDACTGMKPFMDNIAEDTGDPVAAIAERYLKIPCSCMTPNTRRLRYLDDFIKRFKPNAVVDVVLHACHSYNIESRKIEEYVKKNHSLPFLQITTDFSQNDTGQLRTRLAALMEMVNS